MTHETHESTDNEAVLAPNGTKVQSRKMVVFMVGLAIGFVLLVVLNMN